MSKKKFHPPGNQQYRHNDKDTAKKTLESLDKKPPRWTDFPRDAQDRGSVADLARQLSHDF